MQAGVVGNLDTNRTTDVGAGDVEPVGNRRPCRQRKPATSSSPCRRSNSPISPLPSLRRAAHRTFEAAQQRRSPGPGQGTAPPLPDPGAGYQPDHRRDVSPMSAQLQIRSTVEMCRSRHGDAFWSLLAP